MNHDRNSLVSTRSPIIIFSAACALLTVITTIGIHSSLFDFGPLNIQQQAELWDNSWYHFGKWWVIVHCLMVVFSMWGLLLLQGTNKLQLTVPGFVFYCLFAFTEIFRQLLALFYLNGLRQNFLNAETESIQDAIQLHIQNFSLFAYGMFGLFILAFAIANIFYGLSLIKGRKWDNILGYMLMIWGIQGMLVLGNEFWNIEWLSAGIENFSLVFQPLVRLFIGLWFIKIIFDKDGFTHQDMKLMS